MIYLFITFIAFSILFIIKNHHSKNIIWFCFMLIGFCLAFVGLSFYNEYINGYREESFFGYLAKYMWVLDYYLNLDISKEYRLMNIGTALYIYGAVCYPISYLNNRKYRNISLILLSIVPILMMILYEPKIIFLLYGSDSNSIFIKVNKQVSDFYQILNTIFNTAIKLYLGISGCIYLYILKMIIPILRKKFKYIFLGVTPIHILFLVLFYWFPNHNVLSRRFFLLSSISAPYNKWLYGFITYFGIFSILILFFAMWKYNIFEINIRKNRIDFERQMDTAHVGLKVLTHSIKNQIIAIKLLTEQLSITKDEQAKALMQQEIVKICNDSIDKMGISFKDTDVIKLNYENVNVTSLIEEIIQKNSRINETTQFLYEPVNDLNLYIDKRQFEKVIDNLILNSVEACNYNQNAVIGIRIEEKSSYGVIRISDNGKGIDNKNIKRVFEPFFSTKPMSSNWGIGLSFCQKVIEAFGGEIEIESEDNKGTSVNIYIPINTKR